MGYGLEVEMIRLAREMDLFTTPYAFNPEEGRMMAEAGAGLLALRHHQDVRLLGSHSWDITWSRSS